MSERLQALTNLPGALAQCDRTIAGIRRWVLRDELGYGWAEAIAVVHTQAFPEKLQHLRPIDCTFQGFYQIMLATCILMPKESATVALEWYTGIPGNVTRRGPVYTFVLPVEGAEIEPLEPLLLP